MLYPNAIVLGRTENHREGTVPLGTTLMTNPLMTIVPMQDFSLFADPEFPISFFLEYNIRRCIPGRCETSPKTLKSSNKTSKLVRHLSGRVYTQLKALRSAI